MLPQLIVIAGAFGLDQGVALTRAGETGFAVLTKLVEQVPVSRSTITPRSSDRGARCDRITNFRMPPAGIEARSRSSRPLRSSKRFGSYGSRR
jgi:hypothetical protein